MVVGLGLLSEIYTQLHTIDGLPGPQTYKSSISMGSYPQFVFLHTSFFGLNFAAGQKKHKDAISGQQTFHLFYH